MYALGYFCVVYGGAALFASIMHALLFDDDSPEPIDGTGLPEGY